MRTAAAAAGSSLFFAVAAGVVAGVVPWAITRWGGGGPAVAGPGAGRGRGGARRHTVVLVQAFVRFVREGGAPAPVGPTERLVVGGLYRHVRNPMYVAVIGAIAGQALLLGRPVLLVYAAAAGAGMVAFVRGYEEPLLTARYGEQSAPTAGRCRAGSPGSGPGPPTPPSRLSRCAERVADQHVDDAGAADRGPQHDDTGRVGDDLADPDGVPARGVPAQRVQRGRRARRRGRPRRTCPRWPRTAGRCPAARRRPHRRAHRQRGLVEHHRHVGGRRQLVAHRPHAAAGGVAQPAGRRHGRQQGLDQAVERQRCRTRSRRRAPGRPGRACTADPVVADRCPTRARRRPARPAAADSVRPAGIDARRPRS